MATDEEQDDLEAEAQGRPGLQGGRKIGCAREPKLLASNETINGPGGEQEHLELQGGRESGRVAQAQVGQLEVLCMYK